MVSCLLTGPCWGLSWTILGGDSLGSWGFLWPSGPLGHPGASWDILGAPWGFLGLRGSPGCILGLPWSPGISGGHPGASWGFLGLRGSPGASLVSGGLLCASLASGGLLVHLGASCGRLGLWAILGYPGASLLPKCSKSTFWMPWGVSWGFLGLRGSNCTM